jgi:sugar transferase (PEP-CTERM system associated)
MRLFGHHVYFPILALVAIEFGAAVGIFHASVLLIVADAPSIPVGPSFWSLAFASAVVIGMTSVGLYQPKQRLRVEGVLVRIGVALILAAVVLALIQFLLGVEVRRMVWAWSFAIGLGGLGATRVLFARYIDHEVFSRRVLVYGAGDRAARLLKFRRRSDRRGFNVVAFVPAPGETTVIDESRLVRLGEHLLEWALERGVDEIVVAMDDRRRGFPVGELLKCRFAGIAIVDLVSFLERETGRVTVDLVDPSWLIFAEGFGASTRIRFWSRAFDISVAILMLVPAAPIMIVTAVAVLLDDGLPIFYRQRRVGHMGRLFDVLKFRSMIKNAEADGKARWAGAGDNRITRVGTVLRKLRLDELPQLLNVLRGDMSIVGPRPERPEFVKRLEQTIPYYHERHFVKPGITGWAQVCYPYGSSDQDTIEKLQYDLYYIKHKSLIFDLIVMLQTAEVVLWGKGAR